MTGKRQGFGQNTLFGSSNCHKRIFALVGNVAICHHHNDFLRHSHQIIGAVGHSEATIDFIPGLGLHQVQEGAVAVNGLDKFQAMDQFLGMLIKIIAQIGNTIHSELLQVLFKSSGVPFDHGHRSGFEEQSVFFFTSPDGFFGKFKFGDIFDKSDNS